MLVERILLGALVRLWHGRFSSKLKLISYDSNRCGTAGRRPASLLAIKHQQKVKLFVIFTNPRN
jgi:hypothetical protein